MTGFGVLWPIGRGHLQDPDQFFARGPYQRSTGKRNL